MHELMLTDMHLHF